MSKDQEIFRVFINSVQKARDPAKEQREIMLVQNTMNTVLGQLSEQDRLYYSLEVDPGKLDQWLVVSCCDSLQRRLFEDRKAPYSASSTEDPLLAGTVMQATNALKHLRTLSTSTGLSPDDFIDAIRTTAPALIRLLTDREETTSFRTSDGVTISVDPIYQSRRTMLPDPVSVRFRVDMVGREKAVIEPTKEHRSQLKTKSKQIQLHWLPLEHPFLYEILLESMESRALAEVDACRYVNRIGQTVNLSFLRMIESPDDC